MPKVKSVIIYWRSLFLSIVGAALIVICGTYLYSQMKAPRPQEEISKKVSVLVNKMTQGADEEHKAILELQQMNDEAIPYIVSHLGDNRRLSDPEFLLINKKPGAFEKYAHIGAETIHDALTYILSWMTMRQSPVPFGSSTAAQKIESRKEWVTWCHLQYAENASACDGGISAH